MSQPRYSAARKVDAVRRVVEDGRSVGDVARELGVSQGSLFFWVRRYRQFARIACTRASRPAMKAQQHERTLEPGSLVAYLRRANSA